MTELPFKVWIEQEQQRLGVCRRTIEYRLARGAYKAVRFRRVNRRVVWVVTSGK